MTSLFQDLASVYTKIRRTRGDGNCFFRAFAFACMEKLLNKELEMKRCAVLYVVCVCVCVCVCMCVCVHLCAHVCMCASPCVCTSAYACLSVCACLCVCTSVSSCANQNLTSKGSVSQLIEGSW